MPDAIIWISYKSESDKAPIFWPKVVGFYLHSCTQCDKKCRKVWFGFQFGFTAKHSTMREVHNFLNTSSKKADSKFSMGISLDLRKAVDTVIHKVLIAKSLK